MSIGFLSHRRHDGTQSKRFAASITGGSMGLSRDFKEFVQSLNDNEVRYLIVGGYAVAMHGHPRYTKDLDVWIDPTKANAERMMRALRDFGFGSLAITAKDFTTLDQVIQLGYPPHRIDLLTSLPGVSFRKCYPRRTTIDIDSVSVKVIDRESLKSNKLAVGRPQDLADVEKLQKEQRSSSQEEL